VIFLNYGDTHTFAPRGSFSHYEIFFAPKLVEEGVISPTNALTLFSLSAFGELLGEDGFEKLSFRGEERREIEFILSAMLREYTEEKEEADTVLTHYLNVLLTKFRRASHAVTADDAIEDIWERLRGYIDEHPEENLTLSSLASKSFYNPSYFSRVFKEHFNMSLTEYVNHRRVELAKTLLLKGELSVEEIAYRVGYSSKTSFYRAFMRVTGATPAEYKNKK
jgi:AraC-like DNA-binding protein